MGFQTDTEYENKIRGFFGKYVSTFHSKNGQVLAQLFEQNGQLVAHVAFRKGLKPEKVTDTYYNELQGYAEKQGFPGKLRIIYAE